MPGLAWLPPPGDCWITVPAGRIEVLSVVILPTLNPASDSTCVASCCDLPTTSGTCFWAAPVDTYRVTLLFGGTSVPSAGLALMTRPALTCRRPA